MTHQNLVYPLFWAILTATSLAMEVDAENKLHSHSGSLSHFDFRDHFSDATLRMLEGSDGFLNQEQSIFSYDLPASRILSPGNCAGYDLPDLKQISYRFYLSASQFEVGDCIVDAYLDPKQSLFRCDLPACLRSPSGDLTIDGLPVRVLIRVRMTPTMFLVLPLSNDTGIGSNWMAPEVKKEEGLTQAEIDTFKTLKEGVPESPYEKNFTIDEKALKKLKALTACQKLNLVFSGEEENKIWKYAEERYVFIIPDILKQVVRLHYYGAPRNQIASILQISKESIDKIFDVWHDLEKFRAGLTQAEIDTFKILKEGTPKNPYRENFTIDEEALKKLKALTARQELNLVFSNEEAIKILNASRECDVFITPAILKQVLRLHYYDVSRSQIASILEIDHRSINEMFRVLCDLEKFRKEQKGQIT